jgi:hypothetical protein
MALKMVHFTLIDAHFGWEHDAWVDWVPLFNQTVHGWSSVSRKPK